MTDKHKVSPVKKME